MADRQMHCAAHPHFSELRHAEYSRFLQSGASPRGLVQLREAPAARMRERARYAATGSEP